MNNVHIPDQLDQLSKKELLEFAQIAHEENVKLVRELEKETTRKECSYRVQKRLEEDNQELRQQRFRTYNDEEYIIFFDDGDDHPESMSAPVVMSADKFRELFNTRAQLEKANEENVKLKRIVRQITNRNESLEIQLFTEKKLTREVERKEQENGY
jgi:hypothetical protein